MRKTSDIAMLLGSRSKSRSRSSRGGFGSSFIGFVDGLLGRVGKGRRKDRGQSVPMLVFAICVLVAFGGGFLLGDRLSGGDGDNPLNARIGQKPGFIHDVDTTPMGDEAFVVTAYRVTEDVPDAVARQRTVDLAKYLQSKGLEKARPYMWTKGGEPVWITAVYFDGEADLQWTREMLLNMPDDVPDPLFCDLRIQDSRWPSVWTIE